MILGVLSHLSANRKINAIVEATSTALAAIARYRELTLALEAVDRRASEVSGSIRKVNATFEVQFRATYRAVFRFGFVSRAVRWVRQQLFGGKYFNESDLRQISALLDMAVGLAKLIDVPIMDEFGGLR